MTHITSNYKKKLDNSILELYKRFCFEIVPELLERTIFKELFILGLTLLDVSIIKDWKFTISHINGRNEVRNLIKSLKIY
jgi:chromosome partitioning protein